MNSPLEFLKVKCSARAITKSNGHGGSPLSAVLTLPWQPRQTRMLPQKILAVKSTLEGFPDFNGGGKTLEEGLTKAASELGETGRVDGPLTEIRGGGPDGVCLLVGAHSCWMMASEQISTGKQGQPRQWTTVALEVTLSVLRNQSLRNESRTLRDGSRSLRNESRSLRLRWP